jgi:hypothetical protein
MSPFPTMQSSNMYEKDNTTVTDRVLLQQLRKYPITTSEQIHSDLFQHKLCMCAWDTGLPETIDESDTNPIHVREALHPSCLKLPRQARDACATFFSASEIRRRDVVRQSPNKNNVASQKTY